MLLLDPRDWSPANRVDDVLAAPPAQLVSHACAETHACVVELRTGRTRRWATRSTNCAGSATASTRCSPAGSACAPRWPGRIRWRAARRSRPRPGRAIARSSRRCGRSRTASRRWRSTSTWRCPTPTRRCARSTACAATLPLLLALSANSPFWRGRRLRLRLDAHAAVRRVPAHRDATALRQLLRLRPHDRAAALHRGHPRTQLRVVGRTAPAAARHARGAHHGRPVADRPTWGRWPRSSSAWRAAPASRAAWPHRSCWPRTASSRRATACGRRSSDPTLLEPRPMTNCVANLIVACAPAGLSARLRGGARRGGRAGRRARRRAPAPVGSAGRRRRAAGPARRAVRAGAGNGGRMTGEKARPRPAAAPAGDGDVRARRRHVADERVDLGGRRGPRHDGQRRAVGDRARGARLRRVHPDRQQGRRPHRPQARLRARPARLRRRRAWR